MEIKIIEPIGYCAGVNRAISLAVSAKKDNPNKNIYILGQLVHNHHVENYLNQLGIHSLKGLPNEEMISHLNDGDIAIFTAHGHDEKLEELLKIKNIIFYDATCPIVENNIKIIKSELSLGHQIIYIGKKNHPETYAAINISENVFPYYDDKFDFSLLEDESPFIVNQTTLNIKELDDIYKTILNRLPKARIQKEVCATTRIRQTAVSDIDKNVDVIYIVGDKNSSNTIRLYETAKRTHSVPCYLISEVNDIDLSLLKDKKCLAIASGASTPRELIDDIRHYILNNGR